MAIPAEGWREPGVAGSSGSGVRAGAHRGVCVCERLFIYEGANLQFQISDLAYQPGCPGRAWTWRLLEAANASPPFPASPGLPHLGTEPTAPPHGPRRGPGSEQVGCAGCGCSALAAWHMVGVRGGGHDPGGWRKSPEGWSEGDGDAGGVGTALGQPVSRALPEGGCKSCAWGEGSQGEGLGGRSRVEALGTVPAGERRIPPGMGTARGKAWLHSPRG